ncbi:MAG: SufE family protein [Rubritepida sp.]|jgi:cysteine desulfuration protein SufE|nr:SufE family protein [Rubritepida sp.]MCU0946321.1 SufE family protein [Rubritepida sp.]
MAEAAARPAVEATIAELEEGFALFDDWEDRYRYLMELGRELAPLPPEAMVDANRVSGCQSRVWLTTRLEDGRLRLGAASDAAFVQGILALMLRVLDDRTPAEILGAGTDFLARLGLGEMLSLSRRNGAAAVLARIQAAARAAA